MSLCFTWYFPLFSQSHLSKAVEDSFLCRARGVWCCTETCSLAYREHFTTLGSLELRVYNPDTAQSLSPTLPISSLDSTSRWLSYHRYCRVWLTTILCTHHTTPHWPSVPFKFNIEVWAELWLGESWSVTAESRLATVGPPGHSEWPEQWTLHHPPPPPPT